MPYYVTYNSWEGIVDISNISNIHQYQLHNATYPYKNKKV